MRLKIFAVVVCVVACKPRVSRLDGVDSPGLLPEQTASACQPAPFGEATMFAVFVTGSARLDDSTVEGRFAAGGDVRLTKTLIGGALPEDPERFDLIGGGRVTLIGSEVAKGGIVHAGELQVQSSKQSSKQPGPVVAGAPLDFSAATQDIKSLADRLARAKDLPDGTFRRVGMVATDLQPQKASAVTIAPNSSVVVLVPGKEMRLDNPSVNLIGAAGERTILFFSEAEAVYLGPTTINATVFAPSAVVTIDGTTITGQVIAAGVTGRGQIVGQLFAGCTP